MAFQSTPRLSAFIKPLLYNQCKFKLPTKILSISICSKSLQDPSVKKPAPWPYETKKFNRFYWYFDSTVKRFDENTKIIVVDGNIAVGKTAFAKTLADEFGMVYVPEPTVDPYYITDYGYDLREVDSLMPPTFKYCDVKTFYKNPRDPNVTRFQFRMFMLRYNQYIDALAHLLNTGQGIVLDRCVYSDFVFMEAMYEAGYIRREARNLYTDIYHNCMSNLRRPHLIIYLDIGVDTVMERIKQRNDPAEVNSKVLTKEYLTSIEYYYKQRYLKNLSKHSELIIYDWSNYGDMEVVIEDIEKVDFDSYDRYDEKMRDWKIYDDWAFGEFRLLYTNCKSYLFEQAVIHDFDVPEVYHMTEDIIEYEKVIAKIPGTKYETGFNPDMGDKVLFKFDPPYRQFSFQLF